MTTFSYLIVFYSLTFLLNNSCTKDADTFRATVADENFEGIIEEGNGGSGSNSGTEEENDDEKNDKEGKTCVTDGGKANESGLKTWCWGDVDVPSGASNGRDLFSNGELALSIECSANQVIQEENRLKFVLNPTSPAPASWCKNNYNMRAEIRTMPWEVSHPTGTEEWIGWSYTWDDYKVDPTSNYSIYQVHDGSVGTNPLVTIQVLTSTFGEPNGTLWFINSSQREAGSSTPFTYNNLGIVPKQGETIKFVLRIVWGGKGKGLYQLWANDVLVADVSEATVRPSNPVGGNSKFGIYYSNWRSQSNIQASASAGVTKIATSMGALKIVTRKPGDVDYGENAYSLVYPQ